ncbi:MAG: SIMPL domain-containing protein [Burkholderiales bacterium]
MNMAWLSIRPVMAALGCTLATGMAAAAEPPAPQGVVRLASSASIDVTKDVLSIAFNTTREGADAATVQAQLKQALDAALAEAKKVAKPGQVDVQTGNFSLSPRYTNKGVVNGWQGSTELIVEGRDMQAIGQLSGRITTLTINRVGYNLSRELREKTESEISARAIAGYRAKADNYAKQFGYGGYAIREVEVTSSEPTMPMPQRMSMKSMSAASDDALPVEPGKGAVVVNVSGTVQMIK